MENFAWDALLRVPASEAEHETETSCVPGACPCACLRNMVPVLDADSPEDAILKAQSALGAVTGAVVLSAYRAVPGERYLALVATGHSADEDLKRCSVPVNAGTMVEAVLSDGVVRWIHSARGDVAAVAMAGLHDQGRISGLVVAEFTRGSTGLGKPSAVCLHCVASTLSVVVLRSIVEAARSDELALARYHSVAELAVQVTHDFNNMMQGVLGNAALARMDLVAGSPAIESLSSIEEAATRAAALARKLLNFAHDSARDGCTCDAAKVASDALDLAATLYLKSVPITKSIADQPVLVRMTDNDLENVVMLMIKSSVLRLRPVSSVRLTVGGDAADARAQILVSLEGVAQSISDEDRTESEKLAAAARAQADRAGALLGVSVEPGVIQISIEVAREVATQMAPPPSPEARDSSLKGMRVLVVGAPSPLPILLEALGCVAQAVSTWDEAAQQALSFAPRIALAVAGSEEDMQAAMLGRTLTKVPVVAVCASGVAVPAALSSSIDAIVGLPLELGKLRATLESITS